MLHAYVHMELSLNFTEQCKQFILCQLTHVASAYIQIIIILCVHSVVFIIMHYLCSLLLVVSCNFIELTKYKYGNVTKPIDYTCLHVCLLDMKP